MKKRKRLLSLFVLMLTATGIWAQDMKTTPLTMETLTDGTIKVDMGTRTLDEDKCMKYSVNGGTKTKITQTTTIDVQAGDKVQFFGTSNKIKVYGADGSEISITGGTASVKVYGNIMSLVSEKNYPTVTSLEKYAFRRLFYNNTKLTDASNLLLPATVMVFNCYTAMFWGCTDLAAAPELPARTLGQRCYYHMFHGCTKLTTAPELPAPTLANSCYEGMFSGCSKLNAVTCFARDISASKCTSGWLNNVGSNVTGTKTLTIIKGTPWTENSVSGIPTGWTSNITYAVSLKDGTTDDDKWTATVGQNTTAKVLPVGGLSENDPVTLTYSGRLKVKDVTATTDAEPTVP